LLANNIGVTPIITGTIQTKVTENKSVKLNGLLSSSKKKYRRAKPYKAPDNKPKNFEVRFLMSTIVIRFLKVTASRKL